MGNHPSLLPSPPLASFIGAKTAVHAPFSMENYILRPFHETSLSPTCEREVSHGLRLKDLCPANIYLYMKRKIVKNSTIFNCKRGFSMNSGKGMQLIM